MLKDLILKVQANRSLYTGEKAFHKINSVFVVFFDDVFPSATQEKKKFYLFGSCLSDLGVLISSNDLPVSFVLSCDNDINPDCYLLEMEFFSGKESLFIEISVYSDLIEVSKPNNLVSYSPSRINLKSNVIDSFKYESNKPEPDYKELENTLKNGFSDLLNQLKPYYVK